MAKNVAQLSSTELAKQLADVDEIHLEEIITHARKIREIKIQQEKEAREKSEIELKIEKIPAQILTKVAKQINKISEPAPFELGLSLTIKLKGAAFWDKHGDRSYIDFSDHTLSWSLPKQFKDCKQLQYIGNEIVQDMLEVFTDLQYDFEDQGLAIAPAVIKRNKEIRETLDNLSSIEEKYDLPENAIWNYLVDEGKI